MRGCGRVAGKRGTMDDQELYRALETAFVSTFLGELIPGIIHNFANPLNGIMGRGQIMRRRFDQLSAKLEQSSPQTIVSQEELFRKLSTDIDEINRECDRFYNMFQDISGKFHSMDTHDCGKFSLYQLLVLELRFADYYLAFKHQVKKELQLDENIPPVAGNYAACALCIWAILRQAMQDMQDVGDKRLLVKTRQHQDAAEVRFEYPVASGSPAGREEAGREAIFRSSPAVEGQEQIWKLAAALLRTMGAEIAVEEREGWRHLSVKLKY
jgi:signal transduction histidine kinase